MDGNYKQLFDYATEGIVVINSKGNIVSANNSAEQMFGYDKNELLNNPIETLIPVRYAKNHVKLRTDFANNPHQRPMGRGMNLLGLKKDGEEFPVEISLSYFSNQSDKFIIAFILDITVRKQKEDQLEKAHLDLQRSAEEIKATNAELENFAYISSHDLQEPLRKIQSFGERLKLSDGAVLSDKGKDYLNRMLNASSRMQNLINDLLMFSRLSRKAIDYIPVDLNTILSEVLSDLELQIESSHAKIEASNLPIIKSEPTQMRQLFQNLISNAIKFHKENTPPHIKIYFKPGGENHEITELYFEDNGVGFEEKYLDKIFNIFQRLEAKKYPGSGIGLAVCRKIAQRHGGNITAKSKPGEGSVFIVTLMNNNKMRETEIKEVNAI